MPAARGQGRGNSGVYLHGRYEIQMLDSFGLTAERPVDVRRIYGQKAADVRTSRCRPASGRPTTSIFKAPEFDAAGKQTKGAVITVVHNGVKVSGRGRDDEASRGGAWGPPAKTGPLRLQFHGNPVRFRNIWLVEEK